jgi:hypothetical protein
MGQDTTRTGTKWGRLPRIVCRPTWVSRGTSQGFAQSLEDWRRVSNAQNGGKARSVGRPPPLVAGRLACHPSHFGATFG